jgi:hypothetical protein
MFAAFAGTVSLIKVQSLGEKWPSGERSPDITGYHGTEVGPATKRPQCAFLRNYATGEQVWGGGWRREWDSNPRYGFPYTRFPSERLQPLGHLSKAREPCWRTAQYSGGPPPDNPNAAVLRPPTRPPGQTMEPFPRRTVVNVLMRLRMRTSWDADYCCGSSVFPSKSFF